MEIILILQLIKVYVCIQIVKNSIKEVMWGTMMI